MGLVGVISAAFAVVIVTFVSAGAASAVHRWFTGRPRRRGDHGSGRGVPAPLEDRYRHLGLLIRQTLKGCGGKCAGQLAERCWEILGVEARRSFLLGNPASGRPRSLPRYENGTVGVAHIP